MPLKVLIVAATAAEADVFRNSGVFREKDATYSSGACSFSLLVTGVGSVATSWALTKWFSSNPAPDLAINIGISGSYRDEIGPGSVVVPLTDCFADAGIETKEGFLTLAEAGLDSPDRFPFKGGVIICSNKFADLALKNLMPVNAITVNTASGSEQTISRLLKKYNPGIETMEGATFFYICSGEKIPFLALRSVSNRVEPRNRDKWNIPLALDNLSEKLKEFILMLE